MNIEELRENLDSASVLLLVFGILAGATGSLLLLGDAGAANPSQVASELASTLEKSSGQSFDVVNTDERNGLYRIQLKNRNDRLSTYYVTKDGEKVMVERAITDFQQFQNTVAARSEFSTCLQNQNVVMFGNLSQRATRVQIQLLGGRNMVSQIYADVNRNRTLQRAVQAGVRRIPSFYYNGSVAQGVQTISQLEQFTGCGFNVSTS